MLKQQNHLILQASANDDLLFDHVDGSKVKTVCLYGAFRIFDKKFPIYMHSIWRPYDEIDTV